MRLTVRLQTYGMLLTWAYPAKFAFDDPLSPGAQHTDDGTTGTTPAPSTCPLVLTRGGRVLAIVVLVVGVRV